MATKNDKTTEAASSEVKEMDADAAKAKTIEALKKAKTVVAALKEGNESKMDVAAGVEVCTDQECCHLIKTFFDAVNKKKACQKKQKQKQKQMATKNDKTTEAASSEVKEMDADAAKAKTIEALKKAKTVVAALKEGNESKMDVAAGVEVCTDQECCHLIKTFFDAVNKKKACQKKQKQKQKQMATKNDKTTEAASSEVKEMDADAAKAKTIEALKKAKTVVAALKEGNESKMDVAAGVEVCTDQECCHLIKTFFDAVNKKKACKAETIEALKKAQTIEDLMVDKKSAKLVKQLVAALKEGNESKMDVAAGVEVSIDQECSDLEAHAGWARFGEPTFGELSSDGYCTIS
ncbi:hypothetical protein QL285_017659 [Trifolium repens]|nr:hypothetical protein QL285_017659 [Trifolium repens]